MDDDKRSRGQRHLKNKQKFKPKQFKKHEEPKIPGVNRPRIDLESNWDRYEQEDEDKISIPSGTDFTLLANAPVKSSGRFQFKSEKNAIEEIETADISSNLFNLDLNLLSMSISTSPFHERLGLGEDYFGKSSILHMDREAEQNKLEYHKFIGQLESKKNEEINEILPQIVDTSNKVTGDNKSTNIAKVEEDLEEWLDNILDD